MTDRYPFLPLERQSLSERRSRPNNFVPSPVRRPPYQEQVARVENMVSDLETSIRKGASLTAESQGVDPENVLVITTIGEVSNLYNQLSKIDGLEWQLEDVDSAIEADESFFVEDEPGRPLSASLYLAMANHAGLVGIRRLFDEYQATQGQSMPRGFGAWKEVFEQVKEIRWWGPEDRLAGSDLLEFLEVAAQSSTPIIRFEAELWYSRSVEVRASRYRQFQSAVMESDGRIVDSKVLEPIDYHGVLFEVPAAVASEIVAGKREFPFLQSSSVQYLSASGQTVGPTDEIEGEDEFQSIDQQETTGSISNNPVVAVLDGLPLQNHTKLRGHLIVDDPEDWSESYAAQARKHGTSVVSMIVHGDLAGSSSFVESPVYVRPVLRPLEDDPRIEQMPTDRLEVAFIADVLQRMFLGNGDEAASALSVRIVNYSIGNSRQTYARRMTPMARLFDWASWYYKVLFCISVGNSRGSITLQCSWDEWDRMTTDEKLDEFNSSIARPANLHRLISPAESMHSLTVGAAYADSLEVMPPPHRLFELQKAVDEPGFYSRIGGGYGRSVKPDLLNKGGRKYLQPAGLYSSESVVLKAHITGGQPGLLSAYPHPSGGINNSIYVFGTSYASALTSRMAAAAIRLLSANPYVDDDHSYSDALPMIVRALLAQASEWTPGLDRIKKSLSQYPNSPKAWDLAGFGVLREERVIETVDDRATLIGWGSFSDEGSQRFSFALPSALVGRYWKRLSVSLAWFGPCSAQRKQYRNSILEIRNLKEVRERLGVKTPEGVGFTDASRGTLFSKSYKGIGPVADGIVEFEIECRKSFPGASLEDTVFGLVVSFETRATAELRTFEEIRDQIQQRVLSRVRLHG